MAKEIRTESLKAWYGTSQILKGIDLHIEKNSITAIIGPSGCGKSTFVRCLNRMHEVADGALVEGKVWFENQNLYDPAMDPVDIRRRIGMVFQKPNPFPTMSIFDNVASGLRLNGMRNKQALTEAVEKSLKMAALWNEVKDRLNHSGMSLSGGQQQRLCIARALAIEPEILLMDEPASALDPISTGHVEDLIGELKKEVTIAIVTHNMQQAARIADKTAFFLSGELVEYNNTETMFISPLDKRTEDYLTGRFG
ncbi:phosphate ABC transporter ATP-binding protein PstB [Paenibacillus alginolyticus]|uniref:Phosphate ABC transporter ATP-binding protein PstB n=1 Tax=Paenibacillus alginolyticus TaxID=59839 RepID=A0ABT4G7R8_9BACL|nr:phosphate ABC transporter ATP-binding protein PstB [Paenibacillus alginolyticus]MCY9692211.1 phosphate ABC transporter ATP-binding protein PstB [Paenibacillus alginolyticus]MEC0145950.1 phosphate ABC transporter ATP-binding protein PstB [Paenibacillus alginolyticus]